jgi:murein DD-endopeptidase MepM/ murein hydrolase activator NlpD
MKPIVKDFELKLDPKGDVSQWFGENPDLYARFGLAGHNGLDIVRPHGEILFAVEDGTVVSVKNEPDGYGMNVRFVSKTANEQGFYRLWVYAHNSENLVKVGDEIKAGQAIAKMGNTGFVVSGDHAYWKRNPYAGTHVHLGVRLVKLLKKGGFTYEGSPIRMEVQNYGNGYKGSIDPYALLAGLSVEDELKRTQQKTIIALSKTLKNLLWDRWAGQGIFKK